MKCLCGRFEVPSCCKRYLEDAQGNLVHTETCCYQMGEGFVVSVFRPEPFPAFIKLDPSLTPDKETK